MAITPATGELADCFKAICGWHGLPMDEIQGALARESLDGPLSFSRACQLVGLGFRAVKDGPETARPVPRVHFHKETGGWVVFPNEATPVVPKPASRDSSGSDGESEVMGHFSFETVDARSVRKLSCSTSALIFPSPSTPIPGKPSRKHWFWSAFAGVRGDLRALLPASLMVNTFALVTPIFTMAVYDRVVPNQAIETLWVLALGVGLIYGFDFIIRLLRGSLIDAAGKEVDQILAMRLFRQSMEIDLSSRPASAGNFAAHLRGYETVRDFLASASLLALVDFPFSLLLISAIFWIAGPVGWIPLACALAALIVAVGVQPWLRSLAEKSHQQAISRQALMTEVANGIESVKASNAPHDLGLKMTNILEDSEKVDLRARKVGQFGVNFTILCTNMASVFVLVACVYQISAQQMTMGGMIACSMIVGRAMAPVSSAVSLLLRLYQTKAALKGLDAIMALPLENANTTLRRAPRHPTISLKSVTFTYPGQPLPSLNDVNLNVRAGERIAILGRAGAGKSTLLRILARLLKPSEGLVLMNGIDINQWNGEAIRTSVGYLPQDGVLFYGSIEENVRLGRKDFGEAEFLEAATRAGLPSWVNLHPAGFARQVGERGVLLSGGQRQSVLVARVLLPKPDVLLLDEPTASLDLSNEKQIVDGLAELLAADARKTLILSTHKPALLRLVDRIVVLEQGRVVADGPRDQILAKLRPDAAAT